MENHEKARVRRDVEIRAAVAAGMSLREVAKIVGLSFQRVGQITAESHDEEVQG